MSLGLIVSLQLFSFINPFITLVARLANTKRYKSKKLLKPWQMDTHLRVLSESNPMNTNMTGFKRF